MKRLIFGILTLMLVLGLNGCGNNADLVKNGIMNFNKTITVGEAFDNWKDCKSHKWKSFETDNKTSVVEFRCERKNTKEYMNKVKNLLSNNKKEETLHLDIESNIQIFQWTINKDNTFQINNVQVETVWSDGKKFSDSQQPIEQLKAVYNNEITWDLNNLNKSTAGQLSYIFRIVKARAK